jgi:hypothetical protein
VHPAGEGEVQVAKKRSPKTADALRANMDAAKRILKGGSDHEVTFVAEITRQRSGKLVSKSGAWR